MTITAGPYEAKIPRTDEPAGGFRTAEQELADALEGQAPRLAHAVAEKLSPAQTAELAQVIRRAVAVGIRRRADQETAERLLGLYNLMAQGLEYVECETPECACAVLSEDGQCGFCGKTWETHPEVRDA